MISLIFKPDLPTCFRRFDRLACIGLSTTLLASGLAFGQDNNRMAQLVFSFPTPRKYAFDYHELNNKLSLEIRNTKPTELDALNHYDQSLVSRVLIKEKGNGDVKVELFLRDRNIRVTVNDFSEPFRIVIDLFDKTYHQKHDPITGLPVAHDSTFSVDPDTSHSLIKRQTPSHVQPTSPRSQHSSEKKRQLLQPAPKIYAQPTELQQAVSNVKPGIGDSWKHFPPYIYRLQTASFHDQKSNDSWHAHQADKALSSAEAMADYAGKLFDFGHENRALLAYKQLLHKNPAIFDKNPLHLWKLAEIHLGQANLTLADGYFQALVNKHPGHELAGFARMRRLDIAAIRASDGDEPNKFASLTKNLSRLGPKQSHELKAQELIRKAYWKAFSKADNLKQIKNPNYLPLISKELSESMTNLTNFESQKTNFFVSSLVLNRMLEAEHAWDEKLGAYAAKYFDQFKGGIAQNYTIPLKDKLTNKLNSTVQGYVDKGQFIEAINVYESLPKSLKDFSKDAQTSWALAEAYRKLGQPTRSVRFYEQASQNTASDANRFRAQFWLAITAGLAREELKAQSKNPAQMTLLGRKSRNADQAMANTWENLKPSERQRLLTVMSSPMEDSLNAPTLLKTPPQILLKAWQDALSKTSTSPTTANENHLFSPTAKTVFLFKNLAKRFQQLGLLKQRQEALSLLKKLAPANFNDEPEARKTWARELLGLADEYRRDNNYLEAGRTFALAGSKGEDSENRAEALYKGGLLLYRAGRRNEAIQAFQQCSEDGNNRYYANLCSERLARLNNN